MNFQDFSHMVSVRQQENPSWRFGQTVFNVLFEFRPEKAEEIRTTKLDPFYRKDEDDEFWTEFLVWCTLWMTGM